MKKSTVMFACLLLTISSWAAHREIKCGIHPIDRAKIHPQGDYAAAQSVSSNWSGYVSATEFSGSSSNGTVDAVSGSWIVPTLDPTSNSTFCAIWIGIDGYLNGTVEQMGTSHNWINGAQQNYAWFEMYPHGAFEIQNFPLNNGDIISAQIEYKGHNTFQMVITNTTQDVSTTIPMSKTRSTQALRSSAEWVVEAPYSGAILPLSDFQTVSFDACSAIINGITGAINNMNWMSDEIVMQDSSGIKAQPTALMNNGSSFQVQWENQ